MSIRRASHAGAWYSDNARTLTSELNGWLAKVTKSLSATRALIAPHAGYRYSGATAAHAYKQLQENTKAKRIFLFGPSHCYYLRGCAVTRLPIHETPLGNLSVDMSVIDKLKATKKYGSIPFEADEDEHSLEMQYPYIKLVTQDREDVSIVPVIVGELDPAESREYAKHFLPYLRDEENFFVISSDFCHWGQRFKYRPFADHGENTWNSIAAMDRRGMDLIESLDVDKFHQYLEETENTICGRNPIMLFLAMAEMLNKERGDNAAAAGLGATEGKSSTLGLSADDASASAEPLTFKFLHYAQSDKVKRPNDHSVSYAAGIAYPCSCKLTTHGTSTAEASSVTSMTEE